MTNTLTLEELCKSIQGVAAAFRCVTDYQPFGGPGDKVFPPTYEGGKYAMEQRISTNGEVANCVLLDSVQSQANRMELALLDAWEEGELKLPVIIVNFGPFNLPKPVRVTSLDAPHRIADAILRDSLYTEDDGTKLPFRQSSIGKVLDSADLRNATGLFQLCPTALLLGMWDSTGPRGGLGCKFQRAMVSEIVGWQVEQGKKTSSRIDPLQIMLDAGPVYTRVNGGWTADENQAAKEKGKSVKKGKDGKPSEINHGNITPTLTDGGFTLGYARQTTVISLPALRRLRFPLLNLSLDKQRKVNTAGQAVLVALGLYAAALTREQGADLRSRCQLHATTPVFWELLDTPGEEPKKLDVSSKQAKILLDEALVEANKLGLTWRATTSNIPIALEPSADLIQLVRKSQELQAAEGVEDEGE